MNSESERQLSLEELKQLNRPVEQTPTVPPEPHPSAEEWDGLLGLVNLLEQYTETQTAILRALSNRMVMYPTHAQIEALAREMTLIREMMQQAGKKKERCFSLPNIQIPSIRFNSKLLLIPVILLVLLAAWYSLDALWNGLNTLLS